MPDDLRRRAVAPMERAYAVLTVKAVDDGERVITGIATTPEPDRMGDVVQPLGVSFKNPMPLLWQHMADKPVGTVNFDKPTAKGITFKAKLPTPSEPGTLKDRIDEAWQSMKLGLVRGVSIGFRAEKYAFMEDGGIEFQQTEVLELSLVTIPANAGATIQSVKSFDMKQRALSGKSPPTASPPGVPGSKPKPPKGGFFSSRGNEMKTLKDLRDLRATKAARLEELKTLFSTDGHEASDEESGEFDTLLDDVKSLDQDIRLARLTDIEGKAATPVRGNSQAEASAARGVTVFARNADPEDKFKGQGFVRMLFSKAESFRAQKAGHFVRASEYAAKRWGKTHPQLVQLIKANEIAGGGTGSGEWGAELVGIDNRYRGDFVNFLYAMTVFDRLGLRPAPKNVSVKGQDGAATGYWVGESKAIPVSKPDFSTTDLTILKAAGICVASKELLADSDPAAEQLIRDSLVEAIAQRIDTTFLSTTAASAGVSPAGILNGVAALHTTGTDEAAVRNMVKALYSQFITDKNSSNLKLVMAPGMAKAIGLIVNALGQTSFPGLGTMGGDLLGDQVVTGDNVDPSTVLLVKPSDIWLLDDGLDVSMSDSAMIEQNSAPTGATDTPTAASVTMVSMFQEDSVAIKVVRRVSYKKRRTNAVTWVDDADFDGTVS